MARKVTKADLANPEKAKKIYQEIGDLLAANGHVEASKKAFAAAHNPPPAGPRVITAKAPRSPSARAKRIPPDKG